MSVYGLYRYYKIIKTLYDKLTAKLLINGTRSRIIKILRGMKQGDALSCAIFIICIDPLIRNINADRSILALELETRITKEKVKFKSGAFADDVGALCRGNANSVQSVFTQYEKLTKKSGLLLNADKTEILSLESDVEKMYEVEYMGKKVKITTIKEVKVCGIWYCNCYKK